MKRLVSLLSTAVMLIAAVGFASMTPAAFAATGSTINGILIGSGSQVASGTLTVSATVLGYISINLDAATIALGTLNTATQNTGAVTVTYSSNATGGVVVSMASNGLADVTSGRQIGSASGTAVATNGNAANLYQFATGATIQPVGTISMTGSQVLVQSATGFASGTTAVTIGALISATTEAGNYSDTLTFTATSNF